VIEQRIGGADGCVETLEVADLSDALMPSREPYEFLRLGQRGGDWLFHQDIDAGFDQGARDAEMVARGHGNGGRLNFVPGEKLVQRSESAGVEFASHGLGSGWVGIDNRRQVDRLALPFQFVIDARVIPPERAGADYSDINAGRWQGHCLV
jgi:hypothetical protein